MFKAIVVDDEPRIRNGIVSYINNNSDTGFEAVASFADGSSAMEYLETNDVQLVISDIKMVDVSGIELAAYIYNNKPHINVILLSGYADFEYARAAIKYNVQEYLTKPTNFTELKSTLQKISSALSKPHTGDIDAFLNDIKQLYADILSGAADSASQSLDRLISGYTHGSEYLGQYVSNIFEIIADRLHATLKPEITADLQEHKKLINMKDSDAIHYAAHEIIASVCAQLSAKDKTTEDMIVAKLIQFVNENFSKNISLQDAAEKVFFNPAYCSRFFKKHTGENFSDYLLKIRMKHAAELLRRNKKINDISRECGYSSPAYFTRIFKEYYNCTPSEYLRTGR